MSICCPDYIESSLTTRRETETQIRSNVSRHAWQRQALRSSSNEQTATKRFRNKTKYRAAQAFHASQCSVRGESLAYRAKFRSRF
jgi:hypothetical protein